jgi:hypothetical protein
LRTASGYIEVKSPHFFRAARSGLRFMPLNGINN